MLSRCQIRPSANAPRTTAVCTIVCTVIPSRIGRLMIGSLGPRGGSFITFGSPFSMASARAGAPSVIRFSHSSWITVSGAGSPASVARKMIMISARLDDMRKNTNLRMLL